MRDAVGSPEGWAAGLQRFAARLRGARNPEFVVRGFVFRQIRRSDRVHPGVPSGKQEER